MKQRTITAFLGLPLLIALVWFEPYGFPLLILLVAVAVVLGTLEFFHMASLAEGQPLTALGLVLALGFVANATAQDHIEHDFLGPLLAAAVVLPMLWLLVVPPRKRVFIRWSWTLTGILYVGFALSCYIALRELDEGREWVFLAILCTFACDTGAYFVGRTWGTHKMAPSISPGKTWEGAAGGFLCTIAAAVLLRAIFAEAGHPLPITYLEAMLIGALIGVLGQVGDLCESQLKRKAGVKDSGNLLPGHGGALDRLDSIIFTGLVVYYYAQFVV
jgi:phosphatidate cytidylyltransferase